MSVSWHLEVPLQVNVGVHESFSVMVFRNRGPRVDIKFLGLALLKFSPSRGCCQCPFPGHLLGVLSFPCCLHHLLFADSQDGCSVRWDLISCCHRFLFCVFFFFLRIKLYLIWPSLSYWGNFEIFQTCLFKKTPTGKDSMFQ